MSLRDYTDANGVPKMGSALWYRLMALESLDPMQMKNMLAFLSGYDDVAFDKAYESAMGKPFGDPEDDDSDIGVALLNESRNER